MFITFEGPEGAGKSTVLRLTAEQLTERGYSVVTTREPGDGPIGPDIRKILLEGEGMDARTELLLFLADRSQHVESVIKPALADRCVVLCDRYADSTIVYQGVARGLDRTQLAELNQFATGGLFPALTLLLDLPPEIGLSRQTKRDRLDSESLEFHQRVRAGFLFEAEQDPERWVVIDATQSIDEVSRIVLHQILSRLK